MFCITSSGLVLHRPLDWFYSAVDSLAGFPDQAEKSAREIIEIDPTFSLSKYADTQPYKDEVTQNRLIDSLRKAGLPE